MCLCDDHCKTIQIITISFRTNINWSDLFNYNMVVKIMHIFMIVYFDNRKYWLTCFEI